VPTACLYVNLTLVGTPAGRSARGLSPPYGPSVRLADGSSQLAEVHWYEAAGIGRKEFKIKHLL